MTERDSPISINSESFEEIMPDDSPMATDTEEKKLPLEGPVIKTPDTSTDIIDLNTDEGKKELKYEIKEEKYKQCFHCKNEVEIFVKECPKCTKYIPSPGECVDLSQINFSLPFPQNLTPPLALPKNFKLPDLKFAKNFPAISGDAVVDDQEFQEKALNSLPLTDNQRAQLIKDLLKDRHTDTRQEVISQGKKLSRDARKKKLKKIINKQKLKQGE